MFVLAIAAATIAGLTVAALAIPVHLDVRLDLADRRRADARLRWLFGLVRVRLSADRPAAAPARLERAGPVDSRRVRRRSRRPNVLAVFRTQGLPQRTARFVRELSGAIHVHRCLVRARFGFDDPADTGQVCGAVLPAAALAAAAGADVQCAPDFERAILAGTAAATVSVVPLRVVVIILLFACSPPVWRAVRAARRTP
jgi:hypothetical protein